MDIGQICNRDVIYVNRDVTVNAAAKLMRHYQTGSLVVVDEADGKRVPVGVLTDRDIVVEIDALDLDPHVLTAGDIMSPSLVTAPHSMSVADAIELMRARRVRRLPIVNSANELMGIVAIDDLLPMLVGELAGISDVVSRQTRPR